MAKVAATLLFAVSAVLLAGGCPGLTGSGDTGSGATTDADRILQLVNAERASQGLSSLTRNAQLDAAALAHATDMRNNNFFAHTGSDGSSPSDRVTTAGYAWTKTGENIGQGSVSPEDMMDLWMNSTGHRANILDPDFTEIGIGVDDQGTTLWVQVFGRP